MGHGGQVPPGNFFSCQDPWKKQVKDRGLVIQHAGRKPKDRYFPKMTVEEHGSGQNRSDRFRRAISSHYASAACESPVRDWKVGKSVRRIS